MNAPSPLAGGPSLVTFTVEVDGKEVGTDVRVESIDIWTALGKVPRARLLIRDGSPVEGTFELSSGPGFVPGKKLTIAAGYDNKKESVLFRGVIVKQGLEITRDRASKLVVEAADEVIRMTLERKNGVFEKIRDSELIEKLVKQNGLASSVQRTAVVHEEVVQYYASDWDLMMTRAEMNGLVVRAAGGKVTVEPPDTRQAPVLAVRYGDSILDLATEMDAATQLAPAAVKSTTWDPSAQKLVEAGPGRVDVTEPGALSSDDLARVFGIKTFLQQTGGPIEKAALEEWSSAELLKSKLAKIRGRVRFQGSALAEPGKTLELGGLGKNFNGTAYMSGVRHDIRCGSWTTTAELGLSPRWFAAEAPHVAAPEASGQLPPISGLQTGIVQKVAKDPAGEYRVLVSLPILRESSRGVWARLAAFYASKEVGAFFYPEVGDEVIVAFMNEDPRYPVILGSVYSKKLPPPTAPEEKNDLKLLRTRGQLEISFDDRDKVLRLATPGGHIFKMDDKSGAISIADSNGNTVSMSKGGVSITAAKNLKLTAKGSVSVEAGSSLKLAAKTSASLEGAQVKTKAQTKLSATANGTAELKSSGLLTVRGSLVKIN